MGTNWYPLRKPVTCLNMSKDGVSIFVNHQQAGYVTLRPDEITDFVRAFQECHIILRTYWGGNTKGIQVDRSRLPINTPDSTYVVNECGEISTVGDVIKQAGRGKIIS